MYLFNNFLEQSTFAFSWTNKRGDNVKMHDETVKIKQVHFFYFS